MYWDPWLLFFFFNDHTAIGHGGIRGAVQTPQFRSCQNPASPPSWVSALDATQQGPHTQHLRMHGALFLEPTCPCEALCSPTGSAGLDYPRAWPAPRIGSEGLKMGWETWPLFVYADGHCPSGPHSIIPTSGMIWKSLLDPTSTPYSLRQTGLRLMSWIN